MLFRSLPARAPAARRRQRPCGQTDRQSGRAAPAAIKTTIVLFPFQDSLLLLSKTFPKTKKYQKSSALSGQKYLPGICHSITYRLICKFSPLSSYLHSHEKIPVIILRFGGAKQLLPPGFTGLNKIIAAAAGSVNPFYL